MGRLSVHNSSKYGQISTKVARKKLCHKANPHAILGTDRTYGATMRPSRAFFMSVHDSPDFSTTSASRRPAISALNNVFHLTLDARRQKIPLLFLYVEQRSKKWGFQHFGGWPSGASHTAYIEQLKSTQITPINCREVVHFPFWGLDPPTMRDPKSSKNIYVTKMCVSRVTTLWGLKPHRGMNPKLSTNFRPLNLPVVAYHT